MLNIFYMFTLAKRFLPAALALCSGAAAGSLAGQMAERGVNHFIDEKEVVYFTHDHPSYHGHSL